MWNYEHETAEINDRYLKYYIFSDYFHDSKIKQVCFIDEGTTVKIVLSCERERRHKYDLEQDESIIQSPEYEYTMYFNDCRYFEKERNLHRYKSVPEYLNGRFKKSARLHEIEQLARKKYYHLRIQLDDGYIDLIFRGFKIDKTIGSIALPKRIPAGSIFGWIKKRFNEVGIEKVREIAASGEYPERTWALEYLRLANDPKTYNLAIKGLDDEEDLARAASLHVLGILGKMECLSKIVNLLNKDVFPSRAITSSEGGLHPIEKRHILDTIDKIIFMNRT